MKTAILGAGKVGTTLGRAFRRHGHEVIYAVRDPEEPRHAKLRAEAGAVVSVREAVRQAEVVVLATPWSATQAVLWVLSAQALGTRDLAFKLMRR